jgi:NAD(P)-dependent dehydrogenase (short-subunit alcohol dehydrogenase family)
VAIESALVTGAASGLGQVIARNLSRSGAHVLIADRDGEAASILLRELRQAGGRGTVIEADLSAEDGVGQVVEHAVDLGSLDLLVNNVGGWLPGPQFPEGDNWQRSLDVNLRMPMLLTQLLLPLLRHGGAVINIASSAGWDSGPYGSPEYAAAKAGLIRFTTAVADFVDRYAVRVSCVVPHWIGLPRAIAEYQRLEAEQGERSGGLIDPEVIAGAVIQLASDPDSAGRVLVVRAGQAPYAIDPASSDPLR